MPSEGGDYEIDVSANTEWEVSGAPNWVNLNPISSNGDDIIAVVVKANESYAERTASLFIGEIVHYLTQAGSLPTITFEGWLEKHLSETDLQIKDRVDPMFDPDGFGIVNLLRYAFDLDAYRPDRGGLPFVTVSIPEGLNERYLMITFTRLTSPLDLEYHVEAGDDLFGWASLGEDFVVSETADETGRTKTVTVRDSVPIHEGDQRFLRVRVEMLQE